MTCNWDNVKSPDFDGCNGCDGCLPKSPAFPCDNCGGQINDLRLIKWRENGKVIRFWVCLPCWRKVYPHEHD
jgi:hypothetical protein